MRVPVELHPGLWPLIGQYPPALASYWLVCSLESPHHTLKQLGQCDGTGGTGAHLMTPSDNLAHLTSHHLHINTLKLHSDSHQSDLRPGGQVSGRSLLIGPSQLHLLLIGRSTKGGSHMGWSLMAVMGVYIILFRMNPLRFSNEEMAFFTCRDPRFFVAAAVHKKQPERRESSRGHFYNFISLPLTIKMIYIQ